MYEEFYGLSFRPFDAGTDQVDYFPALTFRKAITTIGQGLNKGGGIVLVSGPTGVGKTALLAHLSDKLRAEAVTLALLSAGGSGAGDVLADVSQAFGLDDAELPAGKPLAALDLFLQDEARRGSRALLLVDDAQMLEGEGLCALQDLGQLRLGDRALVQMVLAGGPELVAMVTEAPDLDDLRARLTVEFALDGLLPDEIGPYLDARLEKAGWDGNPAFDPAIPQLLFDATGGSPGLVNRAMTLLLERGAIERQTVLRSDMLGDVLQGMLDAIPASAETMANQGEGGDAMERDDEDRAADDGVALANEPFAGVDEDLQQAAADVDPQGLVEAQIVAIEEAFAQRDRSFAKLRREVEELGETRPAQDVTDRLDAIEQRLEEQERVLRHLLIRMITVFEKRDRAPD